MTKEMNYHINEHIRDTISVDGVFLLLIISGLLCAYPFKQIERKCNITYMKCFYFADRAIKHISKSEQSYVFVHIGLIGFRRNLQSCKLYC